MPEYAEFKGWTDGENNLLAAEELEQTQLRRCVNYDVSDKGDLRRRRGRAAVYNGSIQPGSLFSNGKRALFVETGHLWELINYLGAWSRLLVRLNIGARAVTYLDVNGAIYWSNGVNTGVFGENAEDFTWGLHAPVEQPNVVPSSNGGTLTSGTYQVAVTFVNEFGEESGTPRSKEVLIPDDVSTGSIKLFDIPVSTEATTVRVYVSHPNGEGLYRVTDILSGMTSYRITSVDNAVNMLLQTQFGIKPPAGDVLEYHNGRIYIGQGKVVWFTDPLRYGLVKPHRNFMMFPGEVTVIKAVADGIYVCADKTYWISDIDTTNLQQREVLPYGAVKGTGIDIPKSDNVAWFSRHGIVIAGLEAQISNIQEEKSAVSDFTNGAMMFRESRGLRQLVATLGGGEQSAYLAPDYAALEIARRGDAI
jgi:hypothetical protein